MRVTLSCKDDGWSPKLVDYLKDRREVDLTDFDFLAYSKFCEQSARAFGMVTYYSPNDTTIHFITLD